MLSKIKIVFLTFELCRYDLEDEEAYDLGRRAIYHATFRDAASGGIVRVSVTSSVIAFENQTEVEIKIFPFRTTLVLHLVYQAASL